MAKIQKIKEDMLVSKGKKETVYPITVGEAVVTEYDNEKTTLTPALKKIQDKKCGWFTTKVLEGKYHLLGFASKRIWETWEATQNSSLVIMDVITGEVDTTEEGEDPETPEDKTPILYEPLNYTDSGIIYTPSNNITLRGKNLQHWIKVYNGENSNKFLFKIVNDPLGGTNSELVSLMLKSSHVKQGVCSEEGLQIQISRNDTVLGDVDDPEITGNIIIESIPIESNYDYFGDVSEFETRTLVGKCQNKPKFISPNITTLQLNNAKEDSMVKSFRLQGINVTGDTTISIDSNSGLYISKGELDKFNNKTTAIVTASEINAGIDIFVTCIKYENYEPVSVPNQNVSSNLLIANLTNSLSKVITVSYSYKQPENPSLGFSGIVPTILTLDYDDGKTYYEFAMEGSNLTNDVFIRANYPNGSDVDLSPVIESGGISNFTIKYKFTNNSDSDWVETDMRNPIQFSDVNEYHVFAVRLYFKDNEFETLEPFSNGMCNITCGDFSHNITLEFTKSSQPVLSHAIAYVDNPALVEGLLRLLPSDSGQLERILPRDLDEDDCDSIVKLPKNFMAGVTKSKGYKFSNGEIIEPENFVTLEHLTALHYLTNIGESAFAECTNLVTVVIPNSVTSMGNGCFAKCTNLESVTFEDSILNPMSITELLDGCFSECPNLTGITLPNSLTRIRNAVFGRTGLTEITIPNNVSEIGAYLFMECEDLTTVDFGESLKRVPDTTFKNCPNISDVYLRNPEGTPIATTMGQNHKIFEPGCSVTLHVPSDLISGYEASSWANVPNVTITIVALE